MSEGVGQEPWRSRASAGGPQGRMARIGER